jgi:streptogramin lyase
MVGRMVQAHSHVPFGTNKIASIDPETMTLTEYPLPNEGARPRRIALTSDDASGTWTMPAATSAG